MKNKFLLLGATALLSTGAMIVNAAVDDETVVPVRAELVHVHNLNATPIDFGRIGINDGVLSAGDNAGVTLDSAGIETYDQHATVPGYILSNGKKGVIEGTDCEHLDIGSTVTAVDMSIPDPTLDRDIDARADIQCITVGNDANFYGTFSLNVLAGDTIPAGNYTGSLTVTEINPEP